MLMRLLQGREEGCTQRSFFHPLGSTSKAILRTQKGSQHRQLCESSITFDGIEAENFILRKERKS